MPYVKTPLGRWFYEERRAPHSGAPTVVLLHALLFDRSMWRPVLPALEARARVLVLDGPGHGRSERPPRGFTLEQQSDALADALVALEARRAIVMGLSWGGMIAMRLALRRPERVAALALLDTTAEAEPWKSRVKNEAFLALYRAAGAPRWLFDREIAPQMFGRASRERSPELVEQSYRRITAMDRDSVLRTCRAVLLERTRVLEQLARIDVPTLVLTGASDRVAPPSGSRRMAEAIAGAELVELDGVGHMAVLEAPDRVAPHLVRLIERGAGG